jgi:hypothetical protein
MHKKCVCMLFKYIGFMEITTYRKPLLVRNVKFAVEKYRNHINKLCEISSVIYRLQSWEEC